MDRRLASARKKKLGLLPILAMTVCLARGFSQRAFAHAPQDFSADAPLVLDRTCVIEQLTDQLTKNLNLPPYTIHNLAHRYDDSPEDQAAIHEILNELAHGEVNSPRHRAYAEYLRSGTHVPPSWLTEVWKMPGPAQGVPFDLYDANGQFVKNYSVVVSALKPGDLIRVPSQKIPGGRVFEVKSILGDGESSRVIDLGDGWVLRIPAHSGITASGTTSMALSQSELKSIYSRIIPAEQELRAAGIPVVEIDPERSEPPYAIVVKKVEKLFDARAILAKSKSSLNFENSERMARAREGLLSFLKKTWSYAWLNDFNPTQIVYDGKEWILLDPINTGAHVPLRNFSQKLTVIGHEYSGFGDVSQAAEASFVRQAQAAIWKERKAQKKSGRWFERKDYAASSAQEFIDRVIPYPLPPGYTRTIDLMAASRGKGQPGWNEPPARPLKIQVTRVIKEGKNSVTYEVRVDDRYQARLKTLIQGDQEDGRVTDWIKKARKSKVEYLAGDDFILTYDEAVPAEIASTPR